MLRFIAENEGLEITQAEFGVKRDRLAKLLERAADLVDADEKPTLANTAGLPKNLERVRLYSDGASRGNPGPSGAGAVLVSPNGQVVERLG